MMLKRPTIVFWAVGSFLGCGDSPHWPMHGLWFFYIKSVQFKLVNQTSLEHFTFFSMNQL